MNRFLVYSVSVCLCISMCYASWQNPVLLTELNDFQNGYAASRPTISSDGMILFFDRGTPTKPDVLWEARRNPDTGVFDQQRQLTELKNGGSQVYGTWLSPDKLRLYYVSPDPQNLGWGRNPIWLAIRNSIDAPWQLFRRCSELEIEACQEYPSLTADEKVIMWATAPNGILIKKIFIGSRPSILHSFSNFREVTELEPFFPLRNPRISGDGFFVYFRKVIGDGINEAWVGHRESLESPFGNFTPMQDINSQGTNADVCPPWNRQELFYFQRQGEPGNLNATGIFVSEWVDDSFGDAVQNLREAVADKEHAVDLLNKAIAKEQTAAQILATLPPQAMPTELNGKNLKEVLRLVQQSVNKETEAITLVNLTINYLQTALGILLPPLPVQ